jgi:CRP-like cAMP-binding protein
MNLDETRLFQLLDTHVKAPSTSFECLLRNSTKVSVPAETTLMHAKKLSKYFYVIDSGLVRAVFITDEGREYSKEFYWEGDVVFGMRGLITQQPLPYAVITIEDCELFQVSLKAYRDLMTTHPEWKDYHLNQVGTHFLYKELKEELLLLNSNEQKVAQVYRSFPHLVKRVPATLIASYLGLSPVSLSRIKKRLNLS